MLSMLSMHHLAVGFSHYHWPRSLCFSLPQACKRKEQEPNKDRNNSQKKSRLVFTDLQRRTLFAIFKENKRPSKEMQITISQQLGLELTTVSNFFMNARRRSLEKWQDDLSTGGSSSTSSTCTKAWSKDSHLGTSHLQMRTTDTKKKKKPKYQKKKKNHRHQILSWGPSLVTWKHNSLETSLLAVIIGQVFIVFGFVLNGHRVQVRAENESLWTRQYPLSMLGIPEIQMGPSWSEVTTAGCQLAVRELRMAVRVNSPIRAPSISCVRGPRVIVGIWPEYRHSVGFQDTTWWKEFNNKKDLICFPSA